MQRASHLPGFHRELLEEIFDLMQDGAGVFLKNLAGGSQQNAFAASLEKINPKSRLEVAHLLGDVGLRKAQSIGGAAEASCFRHFEEVAQVADLQGVVRHFPAKVARKLLTRQGLQKHNLFFLP